MHQTLFSKIDTSNLKDRQLIAANMAHGTFFCVYAKIEEHKEDNLYKVEFYLQNFKGPVTIGLLDAKPVKKIPSDVDFEQQWTISCEPFNSNQTKTTDMTLEKGKTLDIHLEMGFPPAHLYNPDEPEKSLYVDPQHHERDGETILNLSRELPPNHPDANPSSGSEGGDGSPWLICFHRRNRVV